MTLSTDVFYDMHGSILIHTGKFYQKLPLISSSLTSFQKTMFQLVKQPIAHNLPLVACTFSRTFFSGWFSAWKTQKMIYPPKPSQFTTNNRIFEAWIDNPQDLSSYTLFKQPTLLNFSMSDPKCNNITQALFDVLSNKDRFPNGNQQLNLVNILCDTQGGRDLMNTYAVHKIPTVVLLKNQLVQDSFIPNLDTFTEQDLTEWIKTIQD
jgi:hypothetical protein